jgi:hypothetical protein
VLLLALGDWIGLRVVGGVAGGELSYFPIEIHLNNDSKNVGIL